MPISGVVRIKRTSVTNPFKKGTEYTCRLKNFLALLPFKLNLQSLHLGLGVSVRP